MDDDREKRIQETPAYKRAMKKKEADSAVHKAQQRTFQAMGEFFQEVGSRRQKRGFCKSLFEDTAELTQECNQFLTYCMEHEIVPSWNLFSVWLDCDISTLNAILNLGDERSTILQKARAAIYTILEQFTSSGEGNPGGKIFLMKALWGLSDQPTSIDVNVNVNGSRPQLEPTEIEKMIELTPDNYKLE
ncbi:MAG TPA: hypothetical protein VHO94_04145 [Oscillospiraceae bacterium]|nr:hypothetical protein [Oscillospiraceae bacterium]